MFPLVRQLGLGVMAYAPLATGLLSGLYSPDALPPPGSFWAQRGEAAFRRALAGAAGETLRATQQVAARTGASVAQVALKWVISHPEVSVAISGADTDAQMEENLGAVDVQLAEEDLALLDGASAGLRTVIDRMQ